MSPKFTFFFFSSQVCCSIVNNLDATNITVQCTTTSEPINSNRCLRIRNEKRGILPKCFSIQIFVTVRTKKKKTDL